MGRSIWAHSNPTFTTFTTITTTTTTTTTTTITTTTTLPNQLPSCGIALAPPSTPHPISPVPAASAYLPQPVAIPKEQDGEAQQLTR